MSFIHYELTNSANLAGMAPAPAVAGGFAPAALPPGMAMAGTYIIVNTTTNNRYIGISGNIANRFNTRMATVTEMGLAVATVAAVGVVWGNTWYQNTFFPPPGPGAPPAPPPPMLAVPAPPAAFAQLIDGAPVNFEHLLIRFCVTQLGAGGTVSNNVIAGPYANPTPNPITVRLDWGPMAGLFNADSLTSIWPPGVLW